MLITITLTLSMYEFIFILIDIAAALTAVPMAFLLPALFHYASVADSTCSKAMDVVIIVGSIATSLFCAGNAIFELIETLEEMK